MITAYIDLKGRNTNRFEPMYFRFDIDGSWLTIRYGSNVGSFPPTEMVTPLYEGDLNKDSLGTVLQALREDLRPILRRKIMWAKDIVYHMPANTRISIKKRLLQKLGGNVNGSTYSCNC